MAISSKTNWTECQLQMMIAPHCHIMESSSEAMRPVLPQCSDEINENYSCLSWCTQSNQKITISFSCVHLELRYLWDVTSCSAHLFFFFYLICTQIISDCWEKKQKKTYFSGIVNKPSGLYAGAFNISLNICPPLFYEKEGEDYLPYWNNMNEWRN